jgi:hypothetical protein
MILSIVLSHFKEWQVFHNIRFLLIILRFKYHEYEIIKFVVWAYV